MQWAAPEERQVPVLPRVPKIAHRVCTTRRTSPTPSLGPALDSGHALHRGARLSSPRHNELRALRESGGVHYQHIHARGDAFSSIAAHVPLILVEPWIQIFAHRS